MRSKIPRWQHTYGSLEVVYASKVDDWADELATIRTRVAASPQPEAVYTRYLLNDELAAAPPTGDPK